MPKYVYHCKACDDNFEIVHGMTERQESCVFCSSSSLCRIPQMPNIKTSEHSANNRVQSQIAGSIVKDAIAENSDILKKQKKEATSWEYEPE